MNIVCVSHLRWDFVFQRPQQLLSRAARHGTVLYIEEPTIVHGDSHLHVSGHADGLRVIELRISSHCPPAERHASARRLIAEAIEKYVQGEFVLWYYTPMALPFTYELNATVVVYDCMDELSAFAGAPSEMRAYESELFRIADVVFTGGQSLYDAKRLRHERVLLFPSSVDVPHFARARSGAEAPPDQALIPRPRIGFFGVIDERMDYDLLRGVARERPDWHLVLVGPTAKVDPATLPQAPNLHYLGAKAYAELPNYIAGWDVAMLPFARNESTRFISPTKTPEYLAAGRPVVATSIQDVVKPYGEQRLVRIADSVSDFTAAVEASLLEEPQERQRRADAFLANLSWDRTWRGMEEAISQAAAEKNAATKAALDGIGPREGRSHPFSERGETTCSTISS